MRRRVALALLSATPLAGCSYIKSVARGCPLPESPPHDGIATTVRSVNLPSPYVPKTANLSIIETAPPIRRVVLALPGRGPGNADGESAFLRPYVAHANTPGVAIVSVAGGETYWHPRKGGEDRYHMLLDTVVPWLRNEYHLTGKLGVIGWSMGGYGAFNFATQRPDLFDRACGVSPALWRSATEQASAVPDAFDNASEYEEFDVFTRVTPLRHTLVRVSCGSHDPFYRNAMAYADDLKRAGVKVESDFFEKGCHDAPSWQRTMSDDLNFVIG